MARLSREDGRRSSRPEVLVGSVCMDSSWNPLTSKLRQNLSSENVMRRWSGLVLTLWVVVCLGSSCFGQTDVNDVHVAPREVEKPKEAPKSDLVATTTPGLTAHVRPLKVDVDLVLVPVTITDPMNRLVTGLEKENFQLFEGDRKSVV